MGTYATGQERKEDSKSCVTSVTIILFDIIFLPNFTSLWTDLFVKNQKTLALRKDHDKTR